MRGGNGKRTPRKEARPLGSLTKQAVGFFRRHVEQPDGRVKLVRAGGSLVQALASTQGRAAVGAKFLHARVTTAHMILLAGIQVSQHDNSAKKTDEEVAAATMTFSLLNWLWSSRHNRLRKVRSSTF